MTSSDLLDEREAYWVRKNDAIENGFNATTKIGKQIARNDRIADIVESLERGDTSIAKRYGVALGTVTNIKNRYLE